MIAPFVREVLLPFVAVRAAIALGSWAVLAFSVRQAEFRANAIAPVDALIRWDAIYYLDIAERGYSSASAAFFPLYPSIVRVLGLVVPLAYAAVVVANVSCLVALELLRRLVAREYGARTARRAVAIALVFPTSFFLSAAYAESTYLAATLAVFLAARERHFAIASLAVWLACLARPQGFVCTTVPFLVAWLATDRTVRGFPWFVLASVLALAQLCLLHRISSGDPLAFLHGDGVRSLRVFWGDYEPKEVSAVTVLIDQGFGTNLVRRLLNFGAVGVVLAASFAELRAGRIAFALVGPLALALPLWFQRTLFDAASLGRYALLAFPIYPFLATTPSTETPRRFADLAMPAMQIALFTAYAVGVWAE